MDSQFRRPIVIIGGMGPQASLRFHHLLIEKSKKHHGGDGDEYPHLVHFSLPVEDFISDASRQAAATQNIQELSRVLHILKPATIALACNTAHLLVPHVDFLQSTHFLSMIEVVAHQLSIDGIRSVGLLASPTTIRTKLYENVLRDGCIEAVLPSTSEQVVLEDCIRRVIKGRAGGKESKALHDVATSLVKRGAEAVLLGCTELPLIFKKSNIPAYDCLDIYADAVINRYYLYNGVNKDETSHSNRPSGQ